MDEEALDTYLRDITRINEDGIASFRCDIDDREVEYRLFARVDGARVIVRCALESGKAGFGELDLQGACLYGLSPERTSKAAPTKAVKGEVAVNRMIELDVAAEVPCEVAGAHATARVIGVFSFFLREWGVKELAFEPRALVPNATLERAIAPLGMTKTSGGYTLTGELGATVQLSASTAGDLVTLVVERIVLEARKRPRRDPRYQLLSSSTKSTQGPQLSVQIFELEPDLPTSTLLHVLQASTDPFVASRAVYLAGERGLTELRGPVLRCAQDPAEDHTVRMTALWALAKLGDASDVPALREIATTTSGEISEQAFKAWAELDRESLAASSEAAPFVEQYRSVRFVAESDRTTVALAGTGRALAITKDELLICGWNALWSWSGTAVETLAESEEGFEAIATSADGGVRAAVTGNRLVILDGMKPRSIRIRDGWQPNLSVAVAPDGSAIATAFDRVTLWAPDGQRRADLHEGFARIRYDGAGRLYISADVVKRGDEELAPHGGNFAVAADGRFVLATDAGLELWPGPRAFERVHDEHVVALAFSHDGTRFASGDMGGTIIVWSCDQSAPLRVLRVPDVRISGLAFAPGDRRLYSVSIDEEVLSVWTL